MLSHVALFCLTALYCERGFSPCEYCWHQEKYLVKILPVFLKNSMEELVQALVWESSLKGNQLSLVERICGNNLSQK